MVTADGRSDRERFRPSSCAANCDTKIRASGINASFNVNAHNYIWEHGAIPAKYVDAKGSNRASRSVQSLHPGCGQWRYLSAVWMEVNVVFSFEPSPLVAVMIATAMPAAIRPY